MRCSIPNLGEAQRSMRGSGTPRLQKIALGLNAPASQQIKTRGNTKHINTLAVITSQTSRNTSSYLLSCHGPR